MTINIALVTSEAVVFGCDSIASVMAYYLNPFRLEFEKDSDGNIKLDDNHRATVQFHFDDLEQIVTDAWGGVTKMFEIHPHPTTVVAVTAALAKLCDRPIASIADDFLNKYKARQTPLTTVLPVAKAFLRFMRKRYEEHYKDSEIPEQFRDGPEFLIGGFGRDDNFPSLFRVQIKENAIKPEFTDGRAGISWNGQSDAVERFIRGYDSELRFKIESIIKDKLGEYHIEVAGKSADIINSILTAVGKEMPDGINIDLPNPARIPIPWRQYRTSIAYGNLPLQEAVNSVSFLVNLQAGKARFAQGVATVGGRIHIGYVAKGREFQLLNEPELVHRYTGFGDGL